MWRKLLQPEALRIGDIRTKFDPNDHSKSPMVQIMGDDLFNGEVVLEDGVFFWRRVESETRNFVASVTLIQAKPGGVSNVTNWMCPIQAANKSEAKGIAFDEAVKSNPNSQVHGIIVMEVAGFVTCPKPQAEAKETK